MTWVYWTNMFNIRFRQRIVFDIQQSNLTSYTCFRNCNLGLQCDQHHVISYDVKNCEKNACLYFVHFKIFFNFNCAIRVRSVTKDSRKIQYCSVFYIHQKNVQRLNWYCNACKNNILRQREYKEVYLKWINDCKSWDSFYHMLNHVVC